ncbi:MAG: carotenoid 1,2-hydratase, partial [Verrucomicrobiota bacterium]|nr:carotenoid 1,2-hydratase [Verrucomicrobiota bacterium]
MSRVGAQEWRAAEPGWKYEFPRDHRSHPEFKTEWWYFTGNLWDAGGRRFGYQVTFFRQGVRPPGVSMPARSRFVVDTFKFAHFALTDVAAKRFHHQQRITRGAFGEAGFATTPEGGANQRLAWIDEWKLEGIEPGGFRLFASDQGREVSLELHPAKTWAVHGINGISQKAEGAGRASHYYSATRLKTRGRVTIGGRTMDVTGESWFDHEWATNQLTKEQAGWNWFSLQLDDGTELMLYQMRLRAGGVDPHSSGSFIARDGTVQHLRREDYRLTVHETWLSPESGGRYPIAWEIEVPALQLRLRLSTPVRAQELVFASLAYWEG